MSNCFQMINLGYLSLLSNRRSGIFNLFALQCLCFVLWCGAGLVLWWLSDPSSDKDDEEESSGSNNTYIAISSKSSFFIASVVSRISGTPYGLEIDVFERGRGESCYWSASYSRWFSSWIWWFPSIICFINSCSSSSLLMLIWYFLCDGCIVEYLRPFWKMCQYRIKEKEGGNNKKEEHVCSLLIVWTRSYGIIGLHSQGVYHFRHSMS